MPVLPTEIRKRNGKLVPFETEKIIIAVKKAFFAVTGDAHDEETRIIVDSVLEDIEKTVAAQEGTYVPGVEDVQDLVELAVMERGFYDVAKSYIIYRFEHARQREAQKEVIEEKIEKSELLVKKRSGETELFSMAKLRHTVERAARGYEDDIDVEALVTECRGQLYDGIETRDIAHALVLAARSFIERDPAYSSLASRILLETIIYKDAINYSEKDGGSLENAYRAAFVRNIKEGIAIGILDQRMDDFDFEKLAAALKPERDDLLQYLGTQTLYDRYLVRDRRNHEQHRLLETPQILFMRVAMGLSLLENHKEQRVVEFYETLSSLRFVNSTPTLFHAGTKISQLSSCYLGVVDDSLESIFKAYEDYANMARVDGGVGYSWSKLRGTGSLIKSTQNTSNGVIPFLKIADSVTDAINRSGRRRGAHCVYLETWHYDIEDFLELRKNTGDERRRTHGLNTAHWIPDLFMRRVIEGGMWTLFSPDETPELAETYGREFERYYTEYERKAERGELKLFKQLRAEDLWRKMLTQLFETGHPWINFKDAANLRSPQDHVGIIHSSNLCTEITLPTIADEEVAVCNLGSVNLARHMKGSEVDWKLLHQTVTTGMRMLDNVIDLNLYPIPETRRSNLAHRPVGLGIMGFQDALFMKGIVFDSEEAVMFADESMEHISYGAIMASSELARERGAYRSYKGSKWDRGIFPIDTLDVLEEERGEQILLDRTSRLDWEPVRESVRRHGMRNSNTLACAPTATISNIAGCFPTIEPIYKNIYVKSNISGSFIVVNNYLVEDLKQEGLWNGETLELIKAHEGNLTNISAIPQWIKEKHKEVFSMNPLWLVKTAAHRGKWIDQSQSLNIFYNGRSGKELSELYRYAWQLGLKTTYYLRTLGASAVEQSSVSIDKQANLEKRKAVDAVAAVKKHIGVPVPVAAPAQGAVRTPSTSSLSVPTQSEPKLCKIDDPECESCQ